MPVSNMSDCIHPLVRIHEQITIHRWVTVGLAHVRARLIPLSNKTFGNMYTDACTQKKYIARDPPSRSADPERVDRCV